MIYRVPKGRLKVAQDDSPGWVVPQGRLTAVYEIQPSLYGTLQRFDFEPRTGVLVYFQTSLRDSIPEVFGLILTQLG